MSIEDYWKEATAFADALLPIPPVVCRDEQGKIVRTSNCDKCVMLVECKLKE